MSEQKELINRVQGSNGLKALIQDTTVTTEMSGSKESMDKVLQQLQRDVSSDKTVTAEEGWALVKAIRLVHDYTLLFSAAGDAVLKAEAASTAFRNPPITQG